MKKSKIAGAVFSGRVSPVMRYPNSPGGAGILVSLRGPPFNDQNSAGHHAWTRRKVVGVPRKDNDDSLSHERVKRLSAFGYVTVFHPAGFGPTHASALSRVPPGLTWGAFSAFVCIRFHTVFVLAVKAAIASL